MLQGHHRRIIAIVAFVLACGALTSASYGTTYYVRKTGNNSNNGKSPATAWLTIDKAADTMVAGDRVYIGAGTYAESISPNNDGTGANPIRYYADITGAQTGSAGAVYVGTNGSRPLDLNTDDYAYFYDIVFTGSDQGVSIYQSYHIYFSGCTFSAGSNDEGVWVEQSSVDLTNCTISSASMEGFKSCNGSTSTLTNCSVHHNGSEGVEANGPNDSLTLVRCSVYSNRDGFKWMNSNCTGSAVNCLVHSNTNYGVRMDSAGGSVSLWHITSAYNGTDGFETRNGTATIRNCISAFNGDDGFDHNGGTTTQSYNLAYGNSSANFEGITTGGTNLTVNPVFVGTNDYRLSSSSPAINTGTDASAVTTVDMNGTTRPVNGGWDMGCYEGTYAPLFADVSSSKGFNVQTSTDAGNYGSGLYWGDVDSDGDLDAIITGDTARLMINNTQGASFTSIVTGNVRRQGALADFDGDGDLDFFTCNFSSYDAEALIVNNGTGSFSYGGDAGFDAASNNEGVAAGDFNWDGRCDVIIFAENGNWIGLQTGSGSVTFSESNSAVYGLNDSGDYGNGDYCSAADVNNDGFLDFFYHYNGGKLFLSEGDGTYYENSSGISVTTGNSDKFGSAWGDYDNDGDVDLWASRYASGNTGYLWRNNGDGSFTNVTAAAGIVNNSGQRGACWGDYDNDGDLDLYIATIAGGNALYRNNGNGTFTEIADGSAVTGNNHDCVFVDFDNDGDLDIAVTREDTSNVLLRNGTNNTNYLKVRVVGLGAGGTNKSAMGVRVDLYAANGTTFLARREIGVARGYGGAEPMWVHFGGVDPNTEYVVKVHLLTGLTSVSVTPSAVSTTIGAVTIPQMLTVTEEPVQQMQVTTWTEVDPLDE